MTFSEGNRPTQDREVALEEAGRILPDLDSWTKDGLWGNRVLYEMFGGEELLLRLHQIAEVAQSYPREVRMALSIQGETLVSKDETDKYESCFILASRRYTNIYRKMSKSGMALVGSLVDYLRSPKDDRQPPTTERLEYLTHWTAPLMDDKSLMLLGIPFSYSWDRIIEIRLEEITVGQDPQKLLATYLGLMDFKGKGVLINEHLWDTNNLVRLEDPNIPPEITSAITKVSQRESIASTDKGASKAVKGE